MSQRLLPDDLLLSSSTVGEVAPTATAAVPAKNLGRIHKLFGSEFSVTLHCEVVVVEVT